MNHTQPFKICRCGFVFPSELEMYRKSIPVGLQKTDLKSDYDLELRLCPKCRSTFAIRTVKDLDPIRLNMENENLV